MTDLITPELLARLRALAEAATPGMWKAYDNLGCKRISGPKRDGARQTPRQELASTSGLRDEAQDRANGLLMATCCPPTVLALVDAAEIGLEAKRRMELGRTWRSALTCGCIFEDEFDLDLCTRSCDHHAGLLAELERLRAELARHADLPQPVRSAHAD